MALYDIVIDSVTAEILILFTTILCINNDFLKLYTKIFILIPEFFGSTLSCAAKVSTQVVSPQTVSVEAGRAHSHCNICLLHLTHAAHIHKQLHKAGLRQRGESGQLPTCEVEDPSGSSYLSMPDGVGGVTDDSRPSLLPMVGTGGETAFLSWLNGHLKVRVRIEEHSFLQANCPKIFKKGKERRKGGRYKEKTGRKGQQKRRKNSHNQIRTSSSNTICSQIIIMKLLTEII